MNNIAKYCKDKGMNKEEYIKFKTNIESTALEIISNLTYNGGMYYPVQELLTDIKEEIKGLIIQELKKHNIEFFQDNELYRVTKNL